MAAIRLAEELDIRDTGATMDELRQLAAFSGWGAVPQIFDESNEEFAQERQELRWALNTDEWNAAARSTINAHYTDPAYVQAIWTAVQDLGFTGGRVLEPGCGTFVGLAPQGAQMVGVELDEITANIDAHLYPDAEILAESFADARVSGRFDAVVGNMPFAETRLTDRIHNAGGHSMHNHFLIKSLALTKPGGIASTPPATSSGCNSATIGTPNGPKLPAIASTSLGTKLPALTSFPVASMAGRRTALTH